MKIHWKHEWKAKGWKEYGAYTETTYECECGSETSRFSGRPDEYTTPILVLGVPLALTAIFLIYAWIVTTPN